MGNFILSFIQKPFLDSHTEFYRRIRMILIYFISDTVMGKPETVTNIRESSCFMKRSKSWKLKK